MFTAEQLQELLEIIEKNQLIALGRELGPDFLSEADREILSKFKVDYESLYNESLDSVFTSFHFGMLAEALAAKAVGSFSYDDIRDYIRHGDYIPLNAGEKAAIKSIKTQTFNDLKSLQGRIYKDVNQIGINTLRDQKNFLVQETRQGLLDKKTAKQIANTIAEKTGDWSRDFDRIITFATTQAYETGKAAMIIKQSGESDPEVYKIPSPGACKHCIRLYLTKGMGSEPIIFKLSQLITNGTNIGRAAADWKATLGPVHPYCRCALHYKLPTYKWDTEKKEFKAPPRQEIISGPNAKRKPIRVMIGGTEYKV